MRREKILIILGIVIALSPFYGLPPAVMTGVTIVLGLAVVAIGYTLTKKEAETTALGEQE